MDIKEFKAKIPVRKAVLGIDYGTKRMGLAVSDLSKLIASSYKILYRTAIEKDLLELKKIINERFSTNASNTDRLIQTEIARVQNDVN